MKSIRFLALLVLPFGSSLAIADDSVLEQHYPGLKKLAVPIPASPAGREPKEDK